VVGVAHGGFNDGHRGWSWRTSASFLDVRLGCNDAERPGYPLERVVHPLATQSALTACSSLPRDSLASPNNRGVVGSTMNSLSMPAKPGRIERFMKMTCLASSALRIGMP